MKTQFLICINTINTVLTRDFEFYQSENWDGEAEQYLLEHLRQLFEAVRPDGRQLQLHLTIEVDNFNRVSTNISKLLKKECVIKDHTLSSREIEVLGLIMQGYINKQIAEKLSISFETVRSHRKNILLKTGMPNTAALINHYHQTFFDK